MTSGRQSIRWRYWAITAAALAGTALAADSPPATSTSAATAAPSAAKPAAPATLPAPPPPVPTLTAEQASYDFGVSFGEQLRNAGLGADLSVDAIGKGLKDALGGKKLAPAEQQAMTQYIRSVRDAAGARNKAAAKEFLASNAAQKGVKTTASGLQYKVIAAGDLKAASPVAEDQVSVQYRGKLLDGTEFDSSYARGQPATFPANRVIKGWQEALLLMKPGAKYQLFVPPELGYGMDARPGIPPGSLLVFDVELISVLPAPKTNN
jgi:FKBP-type peptidyl-prolyl cis-trans isomerase